MGIELMPWQEIAARYLTATGPGGRPLFEEVAIVVARQNGKTWLAKPLIVGALRDGLRVMHLAGQSRELPREMFRIIADAFADEPDLFPKRRGRVIWPRFGSGQEEIRLANGGSYRIAAATTGSARGWSNDLVIIDELKLVYDWEVIRGAEHTLKMSPRGGQMVYLSNAGEERSIVLNAVRARAGEDPNLAYLEWSAAPGRRADEVEGWLEANPAIGHGGRIETIENGYRRARLSGDMAGFETETLCRWVPTMRERLVEEWDWTRCASDDLGTLRGAHMAVSMDPGGQRVSAAIAWLLPEDQVALRLIYEATGDPVPIDKAGKDIAELATAARVLGVGFDPMTDAQLAKHLRKTVAVNGRTFANASSRFEWLVRSANLRHADAEPVASDLVWTTRKTHDDTGAYEAVRSDDERPITAALAAIRAVWLASNPSRGEARVW